MAGVRGRVGPGAPSAQGPHPVLYGVPPQVKVSGKGSGRVSVAGMVCAKPGERTRLIHRILTHHPGRRGERNGFKERDFADLLEAAHQQLGGRIVLVRDNSTQHKDALMREVTGRAGTVADRLPAAGLRAGPEPDRRRVGELEERPGQPTVLANDLRRCATKGLSNRPECPLLL